MSNAQELFQLRKKNQEYTFLRIFWIYDGYELFFKDTSICLSKLIAILWNLGK